MLCAELSACAAPGEPTAINSLALGRLPAVAATRPVAAPNRLAVRLSPRLPAVAASGAAALNGTGRHERKRPDIGSFAGRTPATTTVEQIRPEPDHEPTPLAAAPLVPVPPASQPAFSPLSPNANPVALVPPGSPSASAAPLPTAPDANLAPGPSLCSLGRDSTADDVILNTQPCPVDLRPTLKPAEPTP